MTACSERGCVRAPGPQSDKTRGHGTHTLAAVWKEHLAELLQESGR